MSALSFTLGVDPGLSGAFVMVNQARDIRVLRMPTRSTKVSGKKREVLDGETAAAWLDFNRNLIKRAFVEQVSSRPRQAGQFGFGISTGTIHGLLYGNVIPWSLVAPATWKSAYGIKRLATQTKRDTKNEARAIAAQLIPKHAHEFRRVMDDGVAEAALIALWGQEQPEDRHG